jgi:hypothetical protein
MLQVVSRMSLDLKSYQENGEVLNNHLESRHASAHEYGLVFWDLVCAKVGLVCASSFAQPQNSKLNQPGPGSLEGNALQNVQCIS